MSLTTEQAARVIPFTAEQCDYNELTRLRDENAQLAAQLRASKDYGERLRKHVERCEIAMEQLTPGDYVLFNIGGWTLGLSALLAALAPPGRALAWRPLRGLMGLAGVLGLAVNTSFLLGGPGAPLIGPAVVLTALALLGAGLALGRR